MRKIRFCQHAAVADADITIAPIHAQKECDLIAVETIRDVIAIERPAIQRITVTATSFRPRWLLGPDQFAGQFPDRPHSKEELKIVLLSPGIRRYRIYYVQALAAAVKVCRQGISLTMN